MAKDTLASILAFLFAEDKKGHPMPPKHTNTLLQKVRALLHGNNKGE